MVNRSRDSVDEIGPFHRGQIREVQASAAKTHFSQLLDEVEGGTTIVVLRHGRPVARIVPEENHRWQRHSEAFDNMTRLGEAIRKKHGPIAAEDIVSSTHEGHKY